MAGGLIFLDGNKLNFSADNLMRVSADELRLFHKRNLKRLTPELTKSELLNIRLELKIKELEDENAKLRTNARDYELGARPL